MEIRIATLADLTAALAMDDTFETDYVWQMDERSGNGNIAVSFRLTRLPRPIQVKGMVSRDDVAQNFQQGGMVLVAAADHGICGLADLAVSEWNQVLRIKNLAVAPADRHQGVGSRLMRAALKWGQQQQLRVALLAVSTKAYPAICFAQKHGFAFCGFSDRLYPNRDIAMQFALNLR